MSYEKYLTEEVAEDYADGIITRREALRRLGLMGLSTVSASSLLAACAREEPTVAGGPTPSPQASPIDHTAAGAVETERVTYPVNRVVALMDDPGQVAAAIDDLVRAGFDAPGIHVLHGEQGARHVDPSGRYHGLRGRLVRFAQHLGEERGLWQKQADHLSAGGLTVAVPAGDHDQVQAAARVLAGHGALEMVHFGKGHWEPLRAQPAQPHRSARP
jgi:hypothetical protein